MYFSEQCLGRVRDYNTGVGGRGEGRSYFSTKTCLVTKFTTYARLEICFIRYFIVIRARIRMVFCVFFPFRTVGYPFDLIFTNRTDSDYKSNSRIFRRKWRASANKILLVTATIFFARYFFYCFYRTAVRWTRRDIFLCVKITRFECIVIPRESIFVTEIVYRPIIIWFFFFFSIIFLSGRRVADVADPSLSHDIIYTGYRWTDTIVIQVGSYKPFKSLFTMNIIRFL